MTQVESALKEKSGMDNKFGVNLCANLFGPGKGIKLRVPFGETPKRQRKDYYRGFRLLPNHAAHNGSNIDQRVCLRVMVLASELLDLIGASDLSFEDVGGVTVLSKQTFSEQREFA